MTRAQTMLAKKGSQPPNERKTRKEKQAETLKEKTMAQPDTSKKIRFLASQGKPVLEIERLLAEYGVTTHDGNPIRYQHIRNVLVTRLTGEHEEDTAH